mgnify:CR=1 FL=1|jgi:hypothetical protein
MSSFKNSRSTTNNNNNNGSLHASNVVRISPLGTQISTKLAQAWGPSAINITEETCEIFLNEYGIFDLEQRRGFFYALFFSRVLNPNHELVNDAVDRGLNDSDQWVSSMAKVLKGRRIDNDNDKNKSESTTTTAAADISTTNANCSIVDVKEFVRSVPVVSDALKSIREKLKSLSENDKDSFVTSGVYIPLEAQFLNIIRDAEQDATMTIKNNHFTLRKTEKPRTKSYLEVNAKRVNRFGDVIQSNNNGQGSTLIGVDSSTNIINNSIDSAAIVSKSLESSFDTTKQQKSSFLLDTKKRTASLHGYQISGTKRSFENRDGSDKDVEKEKEERELRIQKLKLMKEKEAERKRLADEEMKKRRQNYKEQVEAKKRQLDIKEKEKQTTINTPSPHNDD